MYYVIRLTRMVCEIGGRCPYSCFLVRCCFHDLFKTARSILVQLPSSLFSRRFVRVQVVQPYSSTDMTTTWKKCRFSLSVRPNFHMTDNLFVASHAFLIRVLTSLSVDYNKLFWVFLVSKCFWFLKIKFILFLTQYMHF